MSAFCGRLAKLKCSQSVGRSDCTRERRGKSVSTYELKESIETRHDQKSVKLENCLLFALRRSIFEGDN